MVFACFCQRLPNGVPQNMPKALAALNLLVDCKHRRLMVESDQVFGLQIQAPVTKGESAYPTVRIPPHDGFRAFQS